MTLLTCLLSMDGVVNLTCFIHTGTSWREQAPLCPVLCKVIDQEINRLRWQSKTKGTVHRRDNKIKLLQFRWWCVMHSCKFQHIALFEVTKIWCLSCREVMLASTCDILSIYCQYLTSEQLNVEMVRSFLNLRKDLFCPHHVLQMLKLTYKLCWLLLFFYCYVLCLCYFHTQLFISLTASAPHPWILLTHHHCQVLGTVCCQLTHTYTHSIVMLYKMVYLVS